MYDNSDFINRLISPHDFKVNPAVISLVNDCDDDRDYNNLDTSNEPSQQQPSLCALSPLMIVIGSGGVHLAKLLIEKHKADTSLVECDGMNFLLLACIDGHLPMVRFLLGFPRLGLKLNEMLAESEDNELFLSLFIALYGPGYALLAYLPPPHPRPTK